MSKPKIMGLFRPWSDFLEAAGRTSEIVVDAHVSCGRQEDDEQVVSSTTSTTVTSTVETSDDGNVLDERTTASTSLTDFRTQGSESFDDVVTGTMPSFKDEKKAIISFQALVESARLDSRVFHVPQEPTSRSPVSHVISTRDSNEFNGSSDIISSNYLATREIREFPPKSGNCAIVGTYGAMTVTNSDVMEPWIVSPERISDISRVHPGVYSGIHPGFQSGIYPGIFPLNIYNHSMEEAMQMVHRQDAVAKEMKKMRPKKHNCPHCSMAFSNGGQLTGHIRIHTG